MGMQLKRTLLAIVVWGCCLVAPPARAEVFSFAQYGDIHLIDAGTTTSAFLDRLTAFINHHLDTPVEFVIDTGDIYQGGDPVKVYGAYQAALMRMTIPAYVLRGNHDVGPEVTAPPWRKAMQRDVRFSFSHQGVAFIGFDTAVSRPTWQFPAAGAETLTWLTTERNKLPPGTPVVLFTHVPLGSRMGLPKAYPLVNRQAILDLFRGHRLLAVIGGHYHGAIESIEGGTLFTTTPTISDHRTNHDGKRGGAVRIFTVEDGAIRTRLLPFPAGVLRKDQK